MQTKGEKELQLQKTIGKNLKTARQHVAGMSMLEVMQKVWGISDRKNRLSEIENGARMPSPYILLRLSVLYGVSLDFIFGLSHDIERDLECSRAGRIVQGLRETALDMVDKISMSLAKQVNILPRTDALVVRDRALDIVCFLRKTLNESSFANAAESEDFFDRLSSLEGSCRQLDSVVARHSRIMELTVYDHIARVDEQITSRYITDHASSKDTPLELASFDTGAMDLEG